MVKKTMQMRKMVPFTDYKDVEETVMEVKEEKKKGTQMVWKMVPEEYEYTVKVPCPVVKKTKVPFTNYKEQWCDVEVEVPHEVASASAPRSTGAPSEATSAQLRETDVACPREAGGSTSAVKASRAG